MENSTSTSKFSMQSELATTPLLQEDATKLSPETMRLAGRMPLKTILTLSVGPILSQITNALYVVVDTVWVARALGEDGMAAVSAYSCFDGIGRSFGMLLSSAGSTKVSQLYGKGKNQEASQVVTDLFRWCFLFGLIVPLALNWAIKPCVYWFGVSKEIADMGYMYMIPILVCTFSSDLFLAMGGCLQGEGRTPLFGGMSVGTLVLNGAVLDPLFLLVFKWGLVGASLATTVAEIIGAIVLFVMYYSGRFSVKPQFRQLVHKFSPHTLPALKVGLSQMISQLSQMVPSIIVRKLMGMATTPATINDALAAFNAVIRFNPLTNSVMMAICAGMVPPSSFAFAARMYRRWLWLQFHGSWINFVWGSLVCGLCWGWPEVLAMIFSKDAGYLKMAGPMIKAAHAFDAFAFGRFNAQALLQSQQKGGTATVLALITHFMLIIVFACVLYYTDKDDPVRIAWCYSLALACGLVLSIFFLIKPSHDVFKKMKETGYNDKLVLTENLIVSTNPE